MKKIGLLILLLLSNTYAFDNTISGEVKLFHYDINQENEPLSANTTALGGYLDYQAKFDQSSSANFRFYTSNPLGKGRLQETTLLYESDGNAINTLAVANISHTVNDTKFIIGRQRLFTPMANDDTTRIIPFTYTGITFENSSINNINIYGGYIDSVKHLIEENFEKRITSGKLENGFYYLGLDATLPLNLKLKSYYYYADKLFDSFYNQLEYKNRYKSIDFFLGLQSIYTSKNGDASNITNDSYDTNMLAYKIGFKYKNLSLSNAFSRNSGNGDIDRGYGGFTQLYTSSMYGAAKGSGGAEGLNFTAKYDFTKQVSAKVTYLKTSYDDPTANRFVSWYGGVKYYYLKNNYIHLRYENVDREQIGTDAEYIRIISTFAF